MGLSPSAVARRMTEASNLHDDVAASKPTTLTLETVVEEPAQPSKAVAKESNDLSMLESQVRKRGQKGKRNQGPKVEAPVVDEVYGQKPQSEASQLEATAIRVLFVLFSIVLLEGIFLAASGFLSESLDDFAQNVVYPAFTPTLGVFLACSTLYGLWKSRQG